MLHEHHSKERILRKLPDDDTRRPHDISSCKDDGKRGDHHSNWVHSSMWSMDDILRNEEKENITGKEKTHVRDYH